MNNEEQFDHAQAREIIRFQMSYNKRQIKATWALAFVIVSLYLLEEYFGGSQNIAVLVSMGANVSERVRAGEYYRLLTAVFLHAGIMHVFFNTYVLFALGGFFNRILGESKYLTVFFISGITGSLASVFFGKSQVSVGASGAIWGLFGASLALAFFKTSLLPEAIRLRLRRVTFINLIINLGVSFLPMIDFWAHIGGGVGGFLVSLLIIFRPRHEQLYRLINHLFQAAAFILAILYLISIIYAFKTSEPWLNPLKTQLEKVEFKEVPFIMAVPKGLKIIEGEKNTAHSSYFVFGVPQMDRLVLEVHFFHEDMLEKLTMRQWLSSQQEELLKDPKVPADIKKSVYFRDTTEGGLLYYQQQPKNSDLVVHNYVISRDKYGIKLAFIVSEKTGQNEVNELASQIIKTIQYRALP